MQLKINVGEYWRSNQNGQSRETGNIGYTRRRKSKQKHNTIYVEHHYTQANTNIVILCEYNSSEIVDPKAFIFSNIISHDVYIIQPFWFNNFYRSYGTLTLLK